MYVNSTFHRVEQLVPGKARYHEQGRIEQAKGKDGKHPGGNQQLPALVVFFDKHAAYAGQQYQDYGNRKELAGNAGCTDQRHNPNRKYNVQQQDDGINQLPGVLFLLGFHRVHLLYAVPCIVKLLYHKKPGLVNRNRSGAKKQKPGCSAKKDMLCKLLEKEPLSMSEPASFYHDERNRLLFDQFVLNS